MLDIFYYNKGIKKAELSALKKIKKYPLWIDALKITQKEADTIGKILDLHPTTKEDIVSKNSRIKVEEFPNYLFCIFNGLRTKKDVSLVQIDFVLGKNFIITNHSDEIEGYQDIKKSKEKLTEYFKNGFDLLLHKLIDIEIDNFFPALEQLDDEIELIEEKIAKKAEPEILNKILKLKKKIVYIKKSVFPQREKISYLAKNNYKLISKKSLPYFRDLYDHAIKVSDSIDNYREAISSTFDAYMSAVSNNTNDVMKTLSIIATVALPLTVISGIYGTNFIPLPGANSPYGFWIMIFLMAVVVGIMMHYFKKKKWF